MIGAWRTAAGRRSRAVVALGLVVGWTGVAVAGGGAATAQGDRPTAAQGAVVDTVTQTFPVTGQTVTTRKRVDSRTGKASAVTTTRAGKTVVASKVVAAERAARADRYGKLEPRLAAQLSGVAAKSRVPVSIWVETPEPPLSKQGGLRAHLQRVERFMADQNADVLRAVRRHDRSSQAAQYGPVVFADLTPGQIRAVARRGDVDTVYGTTAYEVMGDDAATTERAHSVWQAGNLGFGNSSRPVVHEPDGVSDYNPYLDNTSHPVTFWCSNVNSRCPAGKQINTPAFGTHASNVAGVIASTHGLVRGIAPRAQMVLSANTQDFSDQNLVDAFEWARGNGGDPTNMSWGSTCPSGGQSFMSRYVDWAVRTLYATFTISSGNTRGCPSRDLQVSAPGVAWSAITVGAFEDDDNGLWSGDSMSGFSRWQNPDFAPGMEKPEVVAVGEDRRTTSDTGITTGGVDGTSFSAPAVAGQVTQMLARRPGQNVWPETNKATVLASAYHDIAPGRSQDGVGGVVMKNSDETYRLGRYRNDFGNASAGSFPKNYPISLTAGQRVRVATAWTSWSTGGGASDTLGADLDLCIIRNATGAVMGCSASIQNAWELVEFTVPASGTYTARVTRFSSEAGWPGSYLGTAWSVRSLPDVCTGAVTVPSTGGLYRGVSTANGPTFFDSYSGWAPSQTGRERVFRITLPGTRDLRVTDTNSALDLHLVRLSTCSGVSNTPSVQRNGANGLFRDNAPAGTYYLIVDGRNGAVGSTDVRFTVTAP